jgi:hypothetical protein
VAREIVHLGLVVVVVPYDPVRDAVVFVQQLRIAAHLAGARLGEVGNAGQAVAAQHHQPPGFQLAVIGHAERGLQDRLQRRAVGGVIGGGSGHQFGRVGLPGGEEGEGGVRRTQVRARRAQRRQRVCALAVQHGRQRREERRREQRLARGAGDPTLDGDAPGVAVR